MFELARTDEAVTLHTIAMPALGEQFGTASSEMCVGATFALRMPDAASARTSTDRALGLLERLDIPAPQIEITCRSVRADALADLSRTSDALIEIQRAIDVARATIPGAIAKRTQLLATRARLERKLGDVAAATATIAEARALGAPQQLLSADDQATLRPPGP